MTAMRAQDARGLGELFDFQHLAAERAGAAGLAGNVEHGGSGSWLAIRLDLLCRMARGKQPRGRRSSRRSSWKAMTLAPRCLEWGGSFPLAARGRRATEAKGSRREPTTLAINRRRHRIDGQEWLVAHSKQRGPDDSWGRLDMGPALFHPSDRSRHGEPPRARRVESETVRFGNSRVSRPQRRLARLTRSELSLPPTKIFVGNRTPIAQGGRAKYCSCKLCMFRRIYPWWRLPIQDHRGCDVGGWAHCGGAS